MSNSASLKRLHVIGGHLTSNTCSAHSDVIEQFKKEGVVVAGGVNNKASLETLAKWHGSIAGSMKEGTDPSQLMAVLEDIFDENIVFLAPTYLKERRSKQFTIMALLGVSKVFKNFRYTRVILSDNAFGLEFQANMETEDGKVIRGIDLITLNDEGKITKFEVMARPPKPVMRLYELQTQFMRDAGLIPPAKK